MPKKPFASWAAPQRQASPQDVQFCFRLSATIFVIFIVYSLFISCLPNTVNKDVCVCVKIRRQITRQNTVQDVLND